MTGDGEQRDVRESLGDLERRLLDLERELRTDASEDATVAAGAVAPTPKGKGRPSEREAPTPEERGGGVAAPPAPPADIDLFAQDARAKVAALRDTLNGLTSATDRLRETAQTVVEDHGRALVRLERATGAPASIVIPAAMPAPVRSPVEPPTAPEPPAEGPTPAEPEHREPELTEPEPEKPEPGRAEPTAATPTIPPRAELPQLPPLPLRRILAALVAIAVLALGYALLFGGGDGDEPGAPADPSGIAATDDAITAAGGGIGAIPQLRTGIEAEVRADLCAGRTAAAIHVIPPGGEGWSCPGIRQVAAPVLVASGFARQTKGGRTCVSVPNAPALDRRRRDTRLTSRRDAAVRAADRDRAFAAGTAFDRRNGLILLAGAGAPGEPCIAPTRGNLRNGTYPLATKLVLYSTAGAADSAEVRQAASRLRSYYSATPPLYAVVLR